MNVRAADPFGPAKLFNSANPFDTANVSPAGRLR
jgi:hypothetical protein